MLEIGEELKLIPFVNVDYYGKSLAKPVPCKVVGINRRHGFFRVEFTYPNGWKNCESFRIVGGSDNG